MFKKIISIIILTILTALIGNLFFFISPPIETNTLIITTIIFFIIHWSLYDYYLFLFKGQKNSELIVPFILSLIIMIVILIYGIKYPVNSIEEERVLFKLIYIALTIYLIISSIILTIVGWIYNKKTNKWLVCWRSIIFNLSILIGSILITGLISLILGGMF